MAKRYYVHSAVYSMPAWNTKVTHWDGIYLNDELWENNIRIIDGEVQLAVEPQGSYGTGQTVQIGVPTFTGTDVVRLGHTFYWFGYQTHLQRANLPYNGNPYGMGLNTIAVQLEVSLLKHYEMSWYVHYLMEVEI